MAEHTPGTWYVNKDPGLSDLAICAESRGTGWGSSVAVCTEREGVNPLPRAEAEANARLIAAAPDLLAACQAIVEYQRLVESDATTGLIAAYGRAFEGAVEAVAKATGQTTP